MNYLLHFRINKYIKYETEHKTENFLTFTL